MSFYQFPKVCVTTGRIWSPCVTNDFVANTEFKSYISEIEICDTHPGGIREGCIRVRRTQKYSVSARRHTRNKRRVENPGVAA